jgi:hypothetical protein
MLVALLHKYNGGDEQVWGSHFLKRSSFSFSDNTISNHSWSYTIEMVSCCDHFKQGILLYVPTSGTTDCSALRCLHTQPVHTTVNCMAVSLRCMVAMGAAHPQGAIQTCTSRSQTFTIQTCLVYVRGILAEASTVS